MYYIIINPNSKSGRGMQIWQKIEPMLLAEKLPYKAMISKGKGDVASIARQITQSTDEANLIILGGDGTINEALQGIRDFTKVNIGYIPTGSSNDLARDMGLCKDPAKILEKILCCDTSSQSPQKSMADIGVLAYGSRMLADGSEYKGQEPAKRYFAVSSGIGFDAAVCEEALSSPIKDTLNKLKLGKLTYLGIALKQLIAAKPVSCELSLDGKPPVHIKRFLFVASMIRQYEGGGFRFCPAANARDGLLDLCFVGSLPKLLILFALPTAFIGKHYMFPHIMHYRASQVEIKTSVPLWVHTDGEVYYKSDHIYLSCEKQKISFLI